MGIALSEIPAVGSLLPAERRELARWLRTQVARNDVINPGRLQAALDASPFAPVSCAELVAIGWLVETPEGLNADTYARRIAAGAVDGERMSLLQAGTLAAAVRSRALSASGLLGGVQLVSVVLYGSAVRSVGNTKHDIGDLDLALEIDVVDADLAERLQAVPPAQRWRAAIVESGWADHLMQGDDRITLAGSLARVLALFNRQLHGLDIPADGRLPSMVTLWARESAGPAPAARPHLVDEAFDELGPCPAALRASLPYIEAQTLATQERAQQLARLVAAAAPTTH